MDSSLAENCQQQQQPHQPVQRQQLQQSKEISKHCLDESLETLTKLAEESLAKCELSVENNSTTTTPTSPANTVKLRKYSDRCLTTHDSKSSSYRISMANLEETQESELDVILGELSLLEAQINCCDVSPLVPGRATHGIVMGTLKTNGATTLNETALRTHSRTNSTISATASESSNSVAHSTCSSSSGISDNGLSSSVGGIITNSMSAREPRTESPDNDSAFSDTVSLLSSESSASSSGSAHLHHRQQQQQQQQQAELHYMQHQQLQMHVTGQHKLHSSKAAKIQLAMQKLEHASIRRLFVKAFTCDGASKSLLVDERMTCGHVSRLLADKNHVQMQLNWALVESLGDLQMERLFEDHELLVDNLITWNSDAGNRVLFQQRADKIALFAKPEIYLPGPQMAPGSQHDEQTRAMLLEEFFESNSQLQVDGPLYMKGDPKKGWKRYHFVLRTSGLYYFPKEKTKNTRDLACLTLFSGNNVYYGIGWKKKWKSPTDYTFGFKSAVDSSLGKSCRTLKMLCAEDMETMEKWITAIRISKYGKQLWHNYKSLLDELNGSDTASRSSFVASMRSESISSISSAVPSQCGSISSALSSISNSSSGRASRASSSSSSGCLSDDNNAFDSEYTTGTIKRKPSMKPNLPLTTMTRQLKEVGEITICDVSSKDCMGLDTNISPERSGTLTRHHGRRKSQESNGSGTLKRRTATNTQRSPVVTPPPVTSNKIETDTVDAVSNEISKISASTLSLDSLPPPPSPPPAPDALDMYGSHLSLASLPPPPPPEDVLAVCKQAPIVPEKPNKSTVRIAPPYKSPPEYKGNSQITNAALTDAVAVPVQKKVSFADSPVLLRRKMCSPEPRQPPYMPAQQLPHAPAKFIANANSISLDFGSPKRLHESVSNPPRDFLKDLQRVMRKKWQVAQKCKQEPATMPHEVLGFRDFSSEELLAHNLYGNTGGSGRTSSHYYRETANVSNWVQEHYGAGAPPLPPPLSALNEYALYENVQSNGTESNTAITTAPALLLNANVLRKKRPPPPPPKRSDSTQLTHRM